MCMYCERRTDVKFGWEQPKLPYHSDNLNEGRLNGNVLENEKWDGVIHDYQTTTPELVLTCPGYFNGEGVGSIYIPIKYCPECGRKLGNKKIIRNEDLLERLDVVRMSDITEIINIIEKSWGVNSIGCPFGSCTEEFANEKMIKIANKNNFPDDVLKLIKANPIKFHKYQKFDNGRGIGRYYANLVRQMKR